jgi:hypothetical protein
MNTTTLNIGNLNHIADLFRCFNSGKHLNRVADPALWAELESGIDTYRGLFGSLGYELKFDERGFAWFHSEDPSNNLTKRSRSLALLFMVIFDYQADEGKPLIRFGDWRLDRELLSKIFNQYNELLMAADIGNLESFIDVLSGAACTYGFAIQEGTSWRLLPAVCRYLDHFEEIAAVSREQRQELSWSENSDLAADDGSEEE